MALTAKEQSFIEYFEDIADKKTYHNVKRSYMKAYPNSSEKAAESNGIRLIRKDKIKAVFNKNKAKIEKKLDLSRESQHKKLKEAFDIAKTGKNAAAMTSAIREQNEMLGYHREKGLNPEKEAAKRAKMTDEERAMRRIQARQRTSELAKENIVPFKAKEAV